MRVGTRSHRRNVQSLDKDHPHACGDKLGLKTLSANRRGSSPCVWGQDADGILYCDHAGIIPMRVGTRNITILFVCGHGDHPHACGDKAFDALS